MNDFTVDTKQVMKALGNLSPKQMNKAYREGLKKAVEPIKEQTKTNLKKSGIQHVTRAYVSKAGKKYKSMVSGIKSSVDVKNAGEEWAKVHILGEFRLKWFEMGTSLRKTRKGASRGSITGKWFFRQAVNEKGKEAEENLDKCISESIMRVWQK